jgi:dTDP-4-amino-4,6-dideoxygalactose transaminase
MVAALGAEGIDTRRYFWPPVHRHRAYRSLPPAALPATDWLAARVISLPIWRDLSDDAVDRVCEVIHGIHDQPDVVRAEHLGHACAPS